jgi:integrase
MFNSSHAFDADPAGGLYEVLANADGVRLSAKSPQGHAMVVELMQRLGLFDQSPMPRRWKPQTDHADTSNITFTHGAPSPSIPEKSAAIEPTPAAAASEVIDAQRPIALQETKPIEESSPSPIVRSDAAAQSEQLSDLTERHLGNMKRGKNGDRSSTKERRYILTLLKNVIGDKPVSVITPEDAGIFADVLSVWPAYLHNQPEFKNMSALNIAAKARSEKSRPIHASTQGKHIKAVKAFFHWCMECEAIQKDPFRFIELKRYRDLIPRKKDPFSTPDLQTLFNADRMRSLSEPHKYWVPLIAFYSGLRVNEIAQLYLDDLKKDLVVDEDGTERTLLYFHVSPFRNGQSLKSLYAHRQVPVHSKLIELGFETYLADVRKSGALHLFPGLTWGTDGPGRVLTQWFNGAHLRKECGIATHTKSLHCFRHTITTLADRCLIPKSVMRTINGHSDGPAIDEKSYVARANLIECKNALEKIRFPDLNTAPYQSEQFAAYLEQANANEVHRKRLLAEGKSVQPRKGRPPKLSKHFLNPTDHNSISSTS